MLARRKVDALSLEGSVADDTLLSAFDVDRIEPEALLFRTGYLTITGEERDGDGSLYTLGYPNQEVRRSLNAVLLGAMAPGFASVAERRNLRRLLRANDFAGVEGLFRAFLAGIPNEWYARTGMAGYEAHDASVFYSHFAAAGMDVRVGESGSRGRADMAVPFNANVYVFEFKLVDREPQGLALARIRERGCADRYRDLGWPIHLIGVEFGREERNIVAFSVEAARTAEYPARPSSATAPPSCAGPHHPPGRHLRHVDSTPAGLLPRRGRGSPLTPNARGPTLRAWKGVRCPSASNRLGKSGGWIATTWTRRPMCCV